MPSDDDDYQDARADLESGECVVFSDERAFRPTQIWFGRKFLGEIDEESYNQHVRRHETEPDDLFPSWERALQAVNKEMERQCFYPNIYHINDHGNVSLLDQKGNSIQSWVCVS